VGAAFAAWHLYHGQSRQPPAPDGMQGCRLGPAYGDAEIVEDLEPYAAVSVRMEEESLLARVAELLAGGQVVGWFQGRMEFGPRALGCRSILGDARSPEMQRRINLKIKHRESFRPFAPAVLTDHAADYFELGDESPYMLIVAGVNAARRLPAGEEGGGLARLGAVRSDIPAVTHVDYSARVQTVGQGAEPRFRRLLEIFGERTGTPVLVNTSFNVRGEPIVCAPTDAYRCFMRTDMDYLVIGDRLFAKAGQPPWREEADWQRDLELD
jgi:carbamoyltransferase